MTVWLDTGWIRSSVAEVAVDDGGYEIIDDGVENGRGQIRVVFEGGVTMTSSELNRWGDVLSGFRTADPELDIDADDGEVVVTVSADEAAYRPEDELP